jgi:ribose transport system ATP-binding protein
MRSCRSKASRARPTFTTSPSRSRPARCSVSAGSSAPGGPSCCAWSTASIAATRALFASTAASFRLLDWSLARNVTLADLGRFSRGLLNRGAEKAAASEQLRALNTVPDDVDRIVRELSGGNQQKVVLARWLLRRCRVLLFDEPTRGVDVGAKSEIYRVIAELASSGIAVVVVSSEMPELIGLCTRILVMREGEVVAEADGATATEFELLRHAVAPTATDPVLLEEIA